MEAKRTLLTTLHGSRLYGLAHEDSDYDWYTVVSGSKKPEHKIEHGHDDLFIGNAEFLAMVYRGVPQACEAVFSPAAWMDPQWGTFYKGIRVRGGEAYQRYERTIANFMYGDFKQVRHAFRLALNLQELREYGRFNPRLTPPERTYVNDMATRHMEKKNG